MEGALSRLRAPHGAKAKKERFVPFSQGEDARRGHPANIPTDARNVRVIIPQRIAKNQNRNVNISPSDMASNRELSTKLWESKFINVPSNIAKKPSHSPINMHELFAEIVEKEMLKYPV